VVLQKPQGIGHGWPHDNAWPLIRVVHLDIYGTSEGLFQVVRDHYPVG
jgi:hypothetical protein